VKLIKLDANDKVADWLVFFDVHAYEERQKAMKKRQ